MKVYDRFPAVDYLAVNGFSWLILHSLAWLSSRLRLTRLELKLRKATRQLERNKRLSGTNTVASNRRSWNAYDWSRGGEEWTESEEWKQSLIRAFIDPYLDFHATTMEIGPGAGRWTAELQPRVSSLVVVDIAQVSLDLVRRKLPDADNLKLLLNDGRSLAGVPDESIHFVWSFDVFVHIAPHDVEAYISEIRRVLKPGGTAVIHHFAGDEEKGGWRSAMSANLMRQLVKTNGMIIREQVSSWGLENEYDVSRHGDVITVFGRTANQSGDSCAGD
jgi:ubiquinone/menaquinone biosynthesis C-methylase UbiE